MKFLLDSVIAPEKRAVEFSKRQTSPPSDMATIDEGLCKLSLPYYINYLPVHSSHRLNMGYSLLLVPEDMYVLTSIPLSPLSLQPNPLHDTEPATVYNLRHKSHIFCHFIKFLTT